ncbi:amidohydrolase family protein [Lachnospiraceae bacterium ASD3451]|uniref:N-acetylglucosamine-6-phosphate deacetylase n=1 Tax=Diplocloster agilis TaxID=2850323 RepID=UPI001D2BAEF6|nr:amidohydrolase family protein [Diplocloster agilis]MBU9745786.1 amidohydrolase family protein [Diplocloster agilis]
MELVHINILEDGEILENYFIRTENGRIQNIDTMDHYRRKQEEVLDGEQQFLCPGFIDIHNHGAVGYDAMDGTEEALAGIAGFHFRNGVTSFLATTMTAPLEQVKNLAGLLERGLKTEADILGIHMEGPFLSERNRGAQPGQYLLSPKEEHLRILDEMKPWIRLITVSPDVPRIGLLLKYCKENGITVSGGHDGAIDEEIYRAIQGGMKSVTHLYCCSSSISRRQDAVKHIGLTEIGLEDDRLYAEVVADGHHIPAALFRLIYKCKGYRKMCLVSDEIRAAGLGDGEFMLGSGKHGVPVTVKDGIALLKSETAYAGSVTPIRRMVERLVKAGTVPIEQACYMASSAPAELLGLKDRGHIRIGCAAHFNILDREGGLRRTVKEDRNG